MQKEADTLLVKNNMHTREVMQDDGVTIKTLVMVSLKKYSDPLICNRLTLVRAYSCKKSCSNNNVMVETRSQRNCVNRAGTVFFCCCFFFMYFFSGTKHPREDNPNLYNLAEMTGLHTQTFNI